MHACIHTYIHTYKTLHIHTHTYTLLYFTLHYVSLRYITLHYITLHYITLHYIPLHTYHYIHTITYTHSHAHIYIYIYIYGFAFFFANRIVRAASSGYNVKIPSRSCRFVRCDENWRKPRMKHRFWGIKFWGRFWSYEVWKVDEVSQEIFEAPTCLVSILCFSCGIAVLWGKLENLSLSKVSKLVVMSLCVASVALPDILTYLQTCRKSLCVADAMLRRRFQKMSYIFCRRQSTLETSIVILRGRRSIWWRSVVCGMLFRGARAVFWTLYALHFTLWTLDSGL